MVLLVAVCTVTCLFTEEGNAFFDPEDPRGMQLSQDAYYFLGGLMKHAYNYTAITPNS